MEQTYKQIAEDAGISPSFFCDIRKGRRRVTPSVARELERVTGVDRMAWLYPEERSNRFIQQTHG